jgi:hypothetical protein
MSDPHFSQSGYRILGNFDENNVIFHRGLDPVDRNVKCILISQLKFLIMFYGYKLQRNSECSEFMS